MKANKQFLVLIVFYLLINSLKSETNKEIKDLDKQIPIVKGENWIDWKSKFNELNAKVWTMITNESLSEKAKELSIKSHLSLNQTNKKLDQILSDQNLSMNRIKRRALEDNIYLYYFYSLLIISSLQLFSSDSMPSIPELTEVKGDVIIEWIESVRPQLIDLHKEVQEMHSTLNQWPINKTSIDETQKLLDKVQEYEGFSAWQIHIGLNKQKVYDFIKYYGKYTPDLYQILVIQKHYLKIAENIELNFKSTTKHIQNTVSKRFKSFIVYETNFWFEFFVCIYLLFGIFDNIYIFIRLFWRQFFL